MIEAWTNKQNREGGDYYFDFGAVKGRSSKKIYVLEDIKKGEFVQLNMTAMTWETTKHDEMLKPTMLNDLNSDVKRAIMKGLIFEKRTF